jgi:predicted RNase H-like HicB family nuclease
MHKYEIIIYWSDQDEAFIAEVPELPKLMAHGDTQSEALANALEAIDLWIKVAETEGIPVPKAKGKLIFA